jgi:hypothetical protein
LRGRERERERENTVLRKSGTDVYKGQIAEALMEAMGEEVLTRQN